MAKNKWRQGVTPDVVTAAAPSQNDLRSLNPRSVHLGVSKVFKGNMEGGMRYSGVKLAKPNYYSPKPTLSANGTAMPQHR
jgi:hypothetical protein